MSSVLSSFAQPVTRTFVVTPNTDNTETGVYFYAASDIDTWYTSNASVVKKVGDVYTIDGTGNNDFQNVLTGDGPGAALNHTLNNIDQRKTLRDMGKEVIIGTSSEPRLLVLRRVQKYANAANASSPVDPAYTGYVVIENNAEDLQGNTGRFTVRVARI
jgi:hypothetical protein